VIWNPSKNKYWVRSGHGVPSTTHCPSSLVGQQGAFRTVKPEKRGCTRSCLVNSVEE